MLAGVLAYVAGLLVTMLASSSVMLVIGIGMCIGLALSCTASNLAMNVTARTATAARRSVAMGAVSVNQACVGNQIPIGTIAPAGDYWNSDLYSVAMFRRVLTADEIATIGGAMAYGDTARP
jgi:hypothetical protein